MTKDDRYEPPKRRLKKSETLEVRIPYETKQAFLNACREDGTTASEVVREQVQSYLEARERSLQEKRTPVMQLPDNVRRFGPRVAAGGVAAIGLAALAVLPSAADPDFKAQFSRLDANGDGALSVDEFVGPERPSADGERNVVIETRTVASGAHAAPPLAKAEVKKEAFTFWLPEEIGESADAPANTQNEYRFVSRHEVQSNDAGGQTKPSRVSFSFEDLRKDEFASIDGNKDGKVNLDEYQARQTAMLTRGFEILDGDGDKSLSAGEYAKIVSPPVKLDMPGAPDAPRVDIPALKQASPEKIDAAFERLDADKDGKLSLKEYLPKA